MKVLDNLMIKILQKTILDCSEYKSENDAINHIMKNIKLQNLYNDYTALQN